VRIDWVIVKMRVHLGAALIYELLFLLTPSVAAQEPVDQPARPPVNAEASATQLAGVPAAGSKLAAEANYCATCHTEPALWDEQNKRLFVSPDVLQHDVHWQKGVDCSDCHGGSHDTTKVNDAHARENGFRATLAEIQPACAHCHEKPSKSLAEGLHAHVAKPDAMGVAGPMACSDCHGASGHGIRATTDTASPLYLTAEVELCGKCHEKSHETYVSSVHGRGLFESGLAVSATCSDCHDPHGPLPVKDERSNLHGTNVIQTCGKCHLFIQQKLQASVHSWEPRGENPQPARAAPGGTTLERPVCTSCHLGHSFGDPKSVGFREMLPGQCANCHGQLAEQYLMSLHGQLTNLGHGPAAKCSDCHGAHNILPVDNPRSKVFGENRVATCAQCHPNANLNFASFDPHADHHNAERSPTLHYIYLAMEVLLYSVFGFFGLHTLLWFIRSILYRMRHGRPRRLHPGEPAYVRFEGFHRALHVVVIVSFLGLALTGLPLKYSDHVWAQRLASALGGFESTSFWHRVCALLTVSYFAAHLIWLARKVYECRRQGMKWREILVGPDSPIPTFRDFKDVVAMFRWFFGLGKRPTFDRWAYWEKFDYWAVFWGVGIIGCSGLLLWFPEFFARFLPGQIFNVAKVIHSEEALLATGFIFTIHFFNTHLRAEKFPMDMSMLTGLVTPEEMEEERPEMVERLRSSGHMERYLAKTPSRSTLILTMIGGFIAVAIGLALLVGILIGVFS
jgi:cytochrome b subunit of formate dehydrogenase